MHWNVRHPSLVTNLKELESVLLQNREIGNVDAYFHPVAPLKLTLETVGISSSAMKKAWARLQIAHQKQEDILVFGDYDADGISATAIMWLTLHHLGYQARPFIPHRTKHGYGLSAKALQEILAHKKPDLIITVDNGIVALEQVKWLKNQGVDVIITDHHQPESEGSQILYPPAHSVIHTTQLCGATVAWMMAKELLILHDKSMDFAIDLLDLCGLATIADQVPLLAANRSFAKFGVEALATTKRPGILALCTLADVDQKSITVTTVNYVLAPRINAMGRLDHGLDALRLLCTTNISRAQTLADTLDTTNTKRQTLTEDLLAIAKAQAETWKDEHLIVAHSAAFHEGVIGLIAGKLMELYYKPAIVMAVGETTTKASARSIAGVNIVELIRLVRSDLLEVGGHPMAAGFGFETVKLEVVRERLLLVAKENIQETQLQPSVSIDCYLDSGLLHEDTVVLLEKFAPFGQGNLQPTIALRDLKVLDAFTMGKEKQHLKLVLSRTDDPAGRPINAVGWRMGELADGLVGKMVEVAGKIELNDYKGKKSVQLLIRDVRVL